MQSKLPWQDILEAQDINADDLAAYHRDVARSLDKLAPVQGGDLKAAHSEIESDHRKRMMTSVKLRADQMMTSERIAQTSAYLVEKITSNTVLWQEVLHYQHNSCFEGEPPSRDKLSLSWIDAIKRDAIKAEIYNPRANAKDKVGPTLFSVRSLPKSAEITALVEELLWQHIKDSTNPAPLLSRVPEDPALLAVYVEGVKLVYKLVERSLRDHERQQTTLGRETYNHSFMSAGEIAFGVLHSLDIVRGLDDTSHSNRHCNGPGVVVFTQPFEAVERQIDKRTEISPSLGHVLCAVSSMSGQYSHGFNLKKTPAKVDEIAQKFISATQAAGLCARLGKDRAIWLPFCDNDVLSLYRCIDAGQYEDDLYTPAQQTAQLIRATMAKELARLPKEIDIKTLRMKLIKPWELHQKQIGWPYRPDPKVAQAYWAAVADALGVTVLPAKPFFSQM